MKNKINFKNIIKLFRNIFFYLKHVMFLNNLICDIESRTMHAMFPENGGLADNEKLKCLNIRFPGSLGHTCLRDTAQS